MPISTGVFLLLVGLAMMMLMSAPTDASHEIDERSIQIPDDHQAVDYPQYQLKKPMPKRAALLLDRLLVALQKAVDNEEMGKGGASRPYVRPLQDYPDISDSPRMHLSDEKSKYITSGQSYKRDQPVADGSSTPGASQGTCLLALLLQCCVVF